MLRHRSRPKTFHRILRLRIRIDHSAALGRARQIHRELRERQRCFRQAHELERLQCGGGLHQRLGIGQAYVFAGEDDHAPQGCARRFACFEQTRKIVHCRIGIAVAHGFDECAEQGKMCLACFIVRQEAFLRGHAGIIDGDVVAPLAAGEMGCGLERAQRPARIPMAVAGDGGEHIACGSAVQDAQARGGVIEGAAQQSRKLFGGKSAQAHHPAARQQRGVDLVGGVLSGGAQKRQQARLHVRQQGILLAAVEAVNLIDEQPGGTPLVGAFLARFVGHLSDVFDARAYRRQHGQGHLVRGGEGVGDGRFARARWSVEDDAHRSLCGHQPAQHAALAQQLLMAHHGIEGRGPHALGERLVRILAFGGRHEEIILGWGHGPLKAVLWPTRKVPRLAHCPNWCHAQAMEIPHLVGPRSPLRALRAQRRLVADHLVVLVVVDGYYVQKECCAALRLLGHRVVEVVLGARGEVGPLSDNLQKILSAVVQHRPDMLLSINYIGFDRANCLTELLDAMGLPTAVWFVDHPLVLAMGWLPLSREVTTMFMWDRSFVPAMRALGAPRVFHLPLATDETLFTPGQGHAEPAQPLGFVGHSLVILEKKWRRDLQPQEQRRSEALSQKLLQDRSCLHDLMPNSALGPPIDRAALVLAFACVLASKQYRLGLLERLPQQELHLTGDKHWAQLLPKASVHPSTDYGEQSAQIYRKTTISINATNLQMPSTVNQRLFDVPAVGGFLLTDNQPEVAELFEVGHSKEMLTYDSAEELADCAAFYARHALERRQMADKARARVLSEHTYRHRLARLVQTMREQHRSRPLGAVPFVGPRQQPEAR